MSFTTRQGSAFFKRSLALVGATALLAPMAGVAQAAPVRTDLSATCEGLTEHPFVDVAAMSSETAQDAIACLFNYGITEGTSATRFSPYEDVQRVDMAVFLARQLDYIADNSDVTLPADVPDAGFEDTATLSEERQAAIDLLAELQITEGKTPTEFKPYEPVLRRDMASFINRVQNFVADELGAEAAYDADEADVVFTDVPATMERSEDIYALQSVGIVEGTGSDNFSPYENVERYQMAFFIMRHLDENIVAGRVDSLVAPMTNQTFMVNPQDEVALDVSTSAVDNTGRRTFTIENPVADAEHQLIVVDASEVTTTDGVVTLNSTDGEADLASTNAAYIELVDGAAAGQVESTTVTPDSGDAIDVVIDSQTAGEEVALIVWFDADEDGSLDVDADGAPTEPFGVSGVTNYILPESGDISTATPVTVSGVNADLGYFDDGTNTFFYDSDDIFRYNGGADVGIDVFEGWLTAGDVITVTYDADGVSIFNTTDDEVPAPSDVTATITSEGDAATTDDNTVEVTWTASPQADAVYTVERTTTEGGPVTTTVATEVTGTSYTDTNVPDDNAGITYEVTAVGGTSGEDDGNSDISDPIVIPAPDADIATITDGAVVETDVTADTNDAAGEATDGDVLKLYFDDDAVVSAGASLQVSGTAGGSAIIENGVNATIAADGDVVTITLTADLVGTDDLTYPLTVTDVAGIESVDGVATTLGGANNWLDVTVEDDGAELLSATYDATGADPTVTFVYNEALDSTTGILSEGNYTVTATGSATAVTSATLSADGMTLTLVLNGTLATGDSVTFDATAEDNDGQTLVDPISFTQS
ncbi:S-layer homology domain-containing protein [Quadrisphaera sp. GCM10027208]|uniref:S-layer homology domain-containing protein n=1 Tax=Quadrisphaera sp. GCM10027208 TaxID=3273423 RepID=UPI003611A4E3